jgi:aspartate-semialdehyde dehydrogenase
MNHETLTVAVVGATGVVGRTMIQVLNEREFPVGELRLLASGRSAGRTVSVDGRTLEIGEAVPEAFDGVDIALFSAGAGISRDLAPAAVARGATVIDNSSAWRMDPNIPLVVSQVNPDDLEGHPGIIANPNCSTMQLAPVLMALRDAVGLTRVVVDTYQSVSGTGADALAELETQIRAHVRGEPKVV